MSARYKETAIEMYGVHYYLKTDLPWIMLLVFYPLALVLRFAFGIWLPVWLHVLFVMLLTAAVFYSLGVNRNITGKIDEKISGDKE